MEKGSLKKKNKKKKVVDRGSKKKNDKYYHSKQNKVEQQQLVMNLILVSKALTLMSKGEKRMVKQLLIVREHFVLRCVSINAKGGD
jgi:hypothetical protein